MREPGWQQLLGVAIHDSILLFGMYALAVYIKELCMLSGLLVKRKSCCWLMAAIICVAHRALGQSVDMVVSSMPPCMCWHTLGQATCDGPATHDRH